MNTYNDLRHFHGRFLLPSRTRVLEREELPEPATRSLTFRATRADVTHVVALDRQLTGRVLVTPVSFQPIPTERLASRASA